MKGRQQKILGILLVVLLLFLVAPVHTQASEKAQEAEVSFDTQFSIKSLQYLWRGYSRIQDNQDGTVIVSGSTWAYQNVDLISLNLQLQVHDGGTWKTIKMWSHHAINTGHINDSHRYPVEFGKRYRVHGRHEVWHNGVYESATTTTSWIIP